MILYNTTFAVDRDAESLLVDFIRKIYIPEAVAAGMSSPLLSKVRPFDDNDPAHASSIALQLLAPSQAFLDRFTESEVPRIFAKMPERLVGELQAFCTELDVLYASSVDGKSC